MKLLERVEALLYSRLKAIYISGEVLICDLTSLLPGSAFEEFRNPLIFSQVRNRKFFVEWPNGADLSADILWHLGMVKPLVLLVVVY